jgi:hypothetical protein
MAQIHLIKRTNTEVVLKTYSTAAGGATIDVIPSEWYITGPNEEYTEGKCSLSIKAIYWGCKKDKQLDITRIVPTTPQFPGDLEWDASGVHSHYYLLNAGHYDYQGFVDNTYASKPIRLIGDGPFHCIIVLGKNGWKTKLEPDQFAAYDDPTQVGS